MPPKPCSTDRQNRVSPGEGLVAFAGLSTLGALNQVGLQQLGRAQVGHGTTGRLGGGAGALGAGPVLLHSVLCILSVCSPVPPPRCMANPDSGPPGQAGRHRGEDGSPCLVPKILSEMSCSHPSGAERKGRWPRCGRDGWTVTFLGRTYPCAWLAALKCLLS